jgi:hypothetical protein
MAQVLQAMMEVEVAARILFNAAEGLACPSVA